MRHSLSIRRSIVLALFLGVGCAQPEPTPPEVAADFATLVDGLDLERPGASVSQLIDFADRHSGYEIATDVQLEIERVTDLADGQYHRAREAAREGRFSDAEAILDDLATHLSETSDGKSAEEHLAFDFYYGKAQGLLIGEQFEEAGVAARTMLDLDLSRAQKKQVEAILDAAGQADAMLSRAVLAEAQIASSRILLYLEMTYAEFGEYPETLRLSDVEEWDPVGSRSILRTLTSIEGYRRTERGVSFTAVTGQNQRVRVIDGVLER